jgi:uncharacterized protein (TIGR02284 family)
MDNDDVISTLNDLIETCKDGEEGFKTCAKDAADSDVYIKNLFVDRAQSCAVAANELQELVRAQGGKPTTGSSVSGTLHRRWVDIKSALLGRDNEAVLNECERGEDVAVLSYRRALEKDLPSSIRSVIERQYQGVLQNHDQIKSLRNQARVTK